jgi:AcrR family transcriptional regulator
MPPIFIDKDEKKKKILKAAIDVFAEKGYHVTRMADVAEGAEIGKGTIYEYFSSKEELFVELFKFVMANPLDSLSQKWPLDTPPDKKLEKLISNSLKAHNRVKKIYYILSDFKAENKGTDEKSLYRLQFAKLYKEYRTAVCEIIADGVKDGTFRKINPDHAASITMAAMEGLMSQWMFDNRAIPLKDIGLLLTDMLLSYLKAGVRDVPELLHL